MEVVRECRYQWFLLCETAHKSAPSSFDNLLLDSPMYRIVRSAPPCGWRSKRRVDFGIARCGSKLPLARDRRASGGALRRRLALYAGSRRRYRAKADKQGSGRGTTGPSSRHRLGQMERRRYEEVVLGCVGSIEFTQHCQFELCASKTGTSCRLLRRQLPNTTSVARLRISFCPFTFARLGERWATGRFFFQVDTDARRLRDAIEVPCRRIEHATVVAAGRW
ncbi:MAG: hypothetical protein KatS3mg110_0965 [Pirellulaceae bacterium]|nr:MAG: hypothetical protein KatS3mg110_0965 [Pirellulaceae bacterium]